MKRRFSLLKYSRNMSAIKRIIYLLCCWLRFTHGYRILAIFPQPFQSHFLFNTAVLSTLRKAGHEIALISPFENSVTNKTFNFNISTKYDIMPRIKAANFTSIIGSKSDLLKISHMRTLYEWSMFEESLCHDIMKSNKIQSALAGHVRFDVMLTEMMVMPGCYLLIAHKLKIPLIGTVPTSPWTSERIIGNPLNPVYIPNAWCNTGNTMMLYDRLKNTLLTTMIYLWETFMGTLLEEMFRRKYFPDIKWTDVNPPALLFLNSHPILQPRPIVPNAIEIGGAHIRPVKPLPEDLRKFIDEAEHGVILMTFGTNNSTMIFKNNDIISIFSSAFASIPQRVIWKLDEPYENITSNVIITDWVFQQDVLSHTNVKAFISHCGAFGMHEAVHTGTPVVGIPLRIDQIHNALLLEELGVAVYLDIMTMTKEMLLDALNEIINDTSYKNNMQKLSKEFKDNPITAAEKIVYWTEYVIRYKGTPHLKAMGATMPFHQYLYLDFIVCLLTVLTVIVLAVFYLKRILMTILAIKPCDDIHLKKNR